MQEAFVMLRRLFTGWNPWILMDGTLYQAGLDIWDFLILIVGTFCVGLVSYINGRKDLHQIFIKQSWICQMLVILFIMIIWFLFGIYGPGFNQANFIYYNF